MEVREVKNKFGLRQKSTGELVGYEISFNDGDFCCNNQYLLQAGSKQIWLVDDPEQAEFVRLNSTPWFNAEYDTPTNDLDPDDLEVVEIDMTVNVQFVEVSIPTPYEFFEDRYAKKEPWHWKKLKAEIEKEIGTIREVRYNWCDILTAREEKKEREKRKKVSKRK